MASLVNNKTAKQQQQQPQQNNKRQMMKMTMTNDVNELRGFAHLSSASPTSWLYPILPLSMAWFVNKISINIKTTTTTTTTTASPTSQVDPIPPVLMAWLVGSQEIRQQHVCPPRRWLRVTMTKMTKMMRKMLMIVMILLTRQHVCIQHLPGDPGPLVLNVGPWCRCTILYSRFRGCQKWFS